MLVCQPVEIWLDNVTVSLPEEDAPAWVPGTTYALGTRVVRDHRIFESMIADNIDVDPATVDQSKVSAKWLFVEYTNAYRAFDGVLDNPTLSDDSFTISVTVEQSFDMLFLFGVRATLVEVQFLNAAGQPVGRYEQSLGGRIVSGWWKWFTQTPSPRKNVAVFSGVPVAARRAEITLKGSDLRLGEIFLGQSFYIGEAQAQTSGRTATASGYQVNDFGRTIWTKRPTRREVTYVVAADRWAFEAIEPRMGDLAGTLVVTVGSLRIPSTIQFGILGTLEWAEDSPDDYLFSFSIKGVS